MQSVKGVRPVTTSGFDDSAFRRGFAHALREMQRGLALAGERGMTVAEVASALAAYQEEVEAWRRQPADRYIEQPTFRPAPASGQPGDGQR